MKIDSRTAEDKDDALILITRGMFKQILRKAFALHIPGPVKFEVPHIDEGSVVNGAIYEGDGKISISLNNGKIIECEFWPDEIG